MNKRSGRGRKWVNDSRYSLPAVLCFAERESWIDCGQDSWRVVRNGHGLEFMKANSKT